MNNNGKVIKTIFVRNNPNKQINILMLVIKNKIKTMSELMI